MYSAFQPNAVQSNAAQVVVSSVTPAPTPAPTSAPATPGRKSEGGYYGPQQRHRTEEEKLQRRIELGILPAPVQKAVAKAVRRVINKAQAERRDEPQPIDWLAWLEANHAQEQRALEHELRKRDVSFEIRYMALVRFELERRLQEAQDAEDQQILAILMAM